MNDSEIPIVGQQPSLVSEPQTIALGRMRTHPQRRNRGRRILFFRWFGFPSWAAARWHLSVILKHLRSILGLRA